MSIHPRLIYTFVVILSEVPSSTEKSRNLPETNAKTAQRRKEVMKRAQKPD